MKWTEDFYYVGRCIGRGDWYNEPEYEDVWLKHEIIATFENDEFRIFIDNCPDEWSDDIENNIYDDIAKRVGCHISDLQFIETQSGVCAYKWMRDELPRTGIHYGWEAIKDMILDYLKDKDFGSDDMRNLYLYGE